MQLTAPAAHNIDPITSHEAAEAVTSSGVRGRNAELVLALLKANPGLTSIELWEAASSEMKAILKEPQEVRRRLHDLHVEKLVEQGPRRKCSIRKTSMVVWTPILKQKTMF